MSKKIEALEQIIEQTRAEVKKFKAEAEDRKALQVSAVRQVRKTLKRAQRKLVKAKMAAGLMPRKSKKNKD